MDRAEVIRLALECGSVVGDTDQQCWTGDYAFDADDLERFASLVSAAVKEEDARICDCYVVDDCGKNDDAKRCAAAIRASIKEVK